MFRKKNPVELLFPRRCPVCDEPVPLKEGLCCKACRTKLQKIRDPYCLRCGKPLSDAAREYCTDCGKTKHLYMCGRSLYEYESAAPSVYRFKYGGRQEYAAFFGQEMAAELGRFIADFSPQALIPVPLSRKRLQTRGYNQAALLAKELGKRLDIPVWEHAAGRVRNTVPQKELNAAERQNNLKKAFKIASNDVKLSTIIIVDDIYTTGSTIDALTEALQSAGAKKVGFVSLSTGSGM